MAAFGRNSMSHSNLIASTWVYARWLAVPDRQQKFIIIKIISPFLLFNIDDIKALTSLLNPKSIC